MTLYTEAELLAMCPDVADRIHEHSDLSSYLDVDAFQKPSLLQRSSKENSDWFISRPKAFRGRRNKHTPKPKANKQANKSLDSPWARARVEKNIPKSQWWYRDLNGDEHGPFSAEQMRGWYEQKYFSLQLELRCNPSLPYKSMGACFVSGDSLFLDKVPTSSVVESATAVPQSAPEDPMPSVTEPISSSAIGVKPSNTMESGFIGIGAPAPASTSRFGFVEEAAQEPKPTAVPTHKLKHRITDPMAVVVGSTYKPATRLNAFPSLDSPREPDEDLLTDVILSGFTQKPIVLEPKVETSPTKPEPTIEASVPKVYPKNEPVIEVVQETTKEKDSWNPVTKQKKSKDKPVAVAKAATEPPKRPTAPVVESRPKPVAVPTTKAPSSKKEKTSAPKSRVVPKAAPVTPSKSLMEIMQEEEEAQQRRDAAIKVRRSATMAGKLGGGRSQWGGAVSSSASLREIMTEQKSAPVPRTNTASNMVGRSAAPANAWARPAPLAQPVASVRTQPAQATSVVPPRIVKPKPAPEEIANDFFWEEPTTPTVVPRELVQQKPSPAKAAPKPSSNVFGGPKMSSEFLSFCKAQLKKLTGSDDTTLVQFLVTLESGEAVREYMRQYLGASSAVEEFANGFIRYMHFDKERATVSTKSSKGSGEWNVVTETGAVIPDPGTTKKKRRGRRK